MQRSRVHQQHIGDLICLSAHNWGTSFKNAPRRSSFSRMSSNFFHFPEEIVLLFFYCSNLLFMMTMGFFFVGGVDKSYRLDTGTLNGSATWDLVWQHSCVSNWQNLTNFLTKVVKTIQYHTPLPSKMWYLKNRIKCGTIPLRIAMEGNTNKWTIFVFFFSSVFKLFLFFLVFIFLWSMIMFFDY